MAILESRIEAHTRNWHFSDKPSADRSGTSPFSETNDFPIPDLLVPRVADRPLITMPKTDHGCTQVLGSLGVSASSVSNPDEEYGEQACSDGSPSASASSPFSVSGGERLVFGVDSRAALSRSRPRPGSVTPGRFLIGNSGIPALDLLALPLTGPTLAVAPAMASFGRVLRPRTNMRTRVPADAGVNMAKRTRLRSGTRLRPFVCDRQGCEKAFTQLSHRTRHERDVHLKQRKYQCPLCGRRFAQRANARVHERTHTSYACDRASCSKTFTRPSDLFKHTRLSHPHQHRSN